MKFKRLFSGIVIGSMLMASLAGCSGGGVQTSNEDIVSSSLTLEQIEEKAKEEGKIASVGMPDSWANWKDTWNGITEEYGIDHIDTDMSSAEEIAKFEAEKKNPTVDIGDVGWAYAPVAVEKGITLPYKTSYWDSVPEWAKDEDGHWMLAYTGSISILANKDLVDKSPKSFKDILQGDYKVSIGDVTAGTQSQMSVLAAAMANGGDESNIQPGIDFFAELAKQGRLATNNNDLANIESGEVEVTMLWDFNALSYRDIIDPDRFDVCIPKEASVRTGYSTILNKYAPNPHSAMLAREYIFSDKGQTNLAKGYAKPIRTDVELPQEIKDKMIPNEQYKNVRSVDFDKWSETSKMLPQMWREQVLVHIN